MRGTDGVAVPRHAVDAWSGVGDDRVIAGQDDRGVGGQERDDVSGQGTGQTEHRPPGLGKDAAIAGDVAGGERAGGAEEVGNGPPSRGDDHRPEQHEEPLIGRSGEDRGKAIQQREGFVR